MFKRQIVYLYHYVNKEKGKNCGFAKVILQDGKGKVDLHLSDSLKFQGEQILYLLTQMEDELVAKKLTDGEMEGVALDEIWGLLICGEDGLHNVVCGSLREQAEFPENIVWEHIDIEEKEIKTESVSEIEEKIEEDETSVFQYDEECRKEKALQNGEECVEEQTVQSCLQEKMLETMEGTEELQEEKMEEKKWMEKIFHSFPRTMLFVGDQQTIGVRLKPHDMVWFPEEYWRMASNPFLLDGYYNFRHIMFFVMEKDGEEIYYLGIPGIFSINDAVTAGKYGFDDFMKGAIHTENRINTRGCRRHTFGYWCREM